MLNVPCMNLRNSNDRPETFTIGSNELIGTNPDNLRVYLQSLQKGIWTKSKIPPLWDGKTSERIVEKLISLYSSNVDTIVTPLKDLVA